MKYFLKIFLSLLLCILMPSIVLTAIAGKNYESVYEENMAASQLNRLKLVDNTNSIIFQGLDQDASRMASTEAFSELGNLTSFARLLKTESYPSKIFPVYAEMDNTVEGLIRIENLPEGSYDTDSQIEYVNVVTGEHFRIGDRVKIKVLSADVSAGHIDFALVEHFQQ